MKSGASACTAGESPRLMIILYNMISAPRHRNTALQSLGLCFLDKRPNRSTSVRETDGDVSFEFDSRAHKRLKLFGICARKYLIIIVSQSASVSLAALARTHIYL